MNLDLVPLGWIHSLACLVALAAGPVGFMTRKGSPRHVLIGRAYMVSMIVLNLTALGVYRLGIFFFPHWLAILTLVLIAAGWGSARLIRRHVAWRYVHLSSMIASYYLLIGGGVNEVYLRVDAARDLLNAAGPQLLGQTHAVVMLVFLVLLLGWNGWEAAKMIRRRLRRAAPYPAGASSR
ncbi:hypothetical protein ACETK8_13980 [Brevundimonas staleyi]|uniref:DUF2306 domain-containing protein n=1 Tax=Brevundimonas staleyi TaxID=74326 RepID=A0ABW0FNE1_9CAUL